MNAPTSAELERDLSGVAAALRAATVVVRADAPVRGPRRTSAAQGSGIVWATDGTIVTNAHVATNDAATVTLADGRTTSAHVVARDRRRGLAVLRADAPESLGSWRWPAIEVGEPATMRPGALVLALGHPLGVEHALAMGVVHAAPDGKRSPYLVADIRLAPGNSGGPLADARGRVVGVNSMIVGGLGLAVSTDAVKRLMMAARPRPSLGVELRPVRVRLPKEAPETSLAMLVLGVAQGGAAARAGLLQGDLLLGFAGRSFRTPDELPALLADAGSGGTLRLDVGRAGRRLSVEVQLGAAEGPHRRAA
jgi:serine protease Do